MSSHAKKVDLSDDTFTNPFSCLLIFGFGLIVLGKGIQALVMFALNQPDLFAQIIVGGMVLIWPVVMTVIGWHQGHLSLSEKTKHRFKKLSGFVLQTILVRLRKHRG